jgi:hypothetical protein
MIRLIFNNPNHDAGPVFDYLNTLRDYDVHYIVLEYGWFGKQRLSSEDIGAMKECVDNTTIHHFSSVINESPVAFADRTTSIADTIIRLLPA